MNGRMKAPRFGKPRLHLRKNTFAWLVALVAGLGASPVWAQSSTTAPVAGVDSARVSRPDSAPTASGRPDTARPDSALLGTGLPEVTRPDSPPPDTAGPAGARPDSAPRDTARPAGTRPDSVAAPAGDTDPVARPPVDSVLAAACKEANGGPPDLLIVTFRPTATTEERAAVAKELGGIVVGPSEQTAPGAWYLQIPGSAVDPSIADRLILMPPVLEVGATRCPS